MTFFQYDECADLRDPIRSDLAEGYRGAWAHIASPGTWLTGVERVAIADETRRSRNCKICRERKAALSPFSLEGEHDHSGILPGTIVDEVHRVATDAARLTEAWYRSLLDAGLTAERYIEALGVAVITISIDRFHDAMGIPVEPLPAPLAGEPTRVRPEGVVEGEAWVPVLTAKRTSEEAGLPSGRPASFVIRALSLVPEELRAWRSVGFSQYVDDDHLMSFEIIEGRSIGRSQIELVAARVSALNECFY